jgi:hypothetical protein
VWINDLSLSIVLGHSLLQVTEATESKIRDKERLLYTCKGVLELLTSNPIRNFFMPCLFTILSLIDHH